MRTNGFCFSLSMLLLQYVWTMLSYNIAWLTPKKDFLFSWLFSVRCFSLLPHTHSFFFVFHRTIVTTTGRTFAIIVIYWCFGWFSQKKKIYPSSAATFTKINSLAGGYHHFWGWRAHTAMTHVDFLLETPSAAAAAGGFLPSSPPDELEGDLWINFSQHFVFYARGKSYMGISSAYRKIVEHIFRARRTFSNQNSSQPTLLSRHSSKNVFGETAMVCMFILCNNAPITPLQ